VLRARFVSFQVLQLSCYLLECLVVQQFAQLGFAEQLAELILIDGQRLGAPFRQRAHSHVVDSSWRR
jgi:hypothetical protein